MRTILVAFAIVFASGAFADTYVEGYTKKDGTIVPGHYRSDANSTKADNWTTKGNTNPYTGTGGTKTYDDYNNYGQQKK